MNPTPPPHAPPPRRNTTFKGDVLRLVTGTGLAQIIAVLAAPILTRLYAPEAFGAAALFVSLTGILGVLACMCYELSIVLPDNDREAANRLGVSLCFSVLIALMTVPVIGYGGPQVLQWVGMPELAPYLWLVPITVLIHGVFTALNYWNTRTKHFARQSIARVTSAVATTSATLGAGFAGHATGGAMIAASVGGRRAFGGCGSRADRTSVFAQYTVFVEERENMQAPLKESGIPTAVHYPVPPNEHPAYRHLCCPDCTPVASAAVAKQVLSLPMSTDLKQAEQERIITALCSQGSVFC